MFKLKYLIRLLYISSAAAAISYGFMVRTGLASSQHSTTRLGCLKNEKWNYSDSIPQSKRISFEDFIEKREYTFVTFAEALDLRDNAIDAEQKAFAEYWISRSLMQIKLYHVAQNGFHAILSQFKTAQAPGVIAATLDCLLKIHELQPTLEPEDTFIKHAISLRKKRNLYRKFAGTVNKSMSFIIRNAIARKKSQKQIRSFMRLLPKKGPSTSLAKGFFGAFMRDNKYTIRHFERFLASPRPKYLTRYEDQVLLLLGRSYYQEKQFEQASNYYQRVRKSSNELTKALSELSWAYLMQKKYADSIGTSVQLQTGTLAETFAPEAPMVMAMSSNELCQYPDASFAVDRFRRDYKSSFRWLNSYWKGRTSRQTKLYDYVTDFLGENRYKIPSRVATQWIRSPFFIAPQQEINLIFKEQKIVRELEAVGKNIQRQVASEVKAVAIDFKPRYKKAKKSGKLSRGIRKELREFKRLIAKYKKIKSATPYWESLLETFQQRGESRLNELVSIINTSLHDENLAMLSSLKKVADNNSLIEIEIYNNASADMIWKNANPDYKRVSKKFKEKDNTEVAQVWDWGEVAEDNQEIWEDELGAFKAKIEDNCTKQRKYEKYKQRLARQAEEEAL